MSDKLDTFSLQQRCPCGDQDPISIRQLIYPETDEFLGIYCEKCRHEWISMPDNIDSRKYDDKKVIDVSMLQRNNPVKQNIGADISPASRTRINRVSQLKKGDHFAILRPFVIWHHGIVYYINEDNSRFEAIHWHKENNGRIRIMKSWFNIYEERGELYRVDYGNVVEEENKKKLTIARAFSMIGRVGYNVFTENCEHFARYCKVGFGVSMQACHCINLVKRSVNNVLQSELAGGLSEEPFSFVGNAVVSCTSAEAINDALNGMDMIGAGVIVFIGGMYMIWDLSKIHSQKKKGDISRKEYVKSVIGRITEAICSEAITVAFRFAGEIGGGYAGGMLGTLICPGVGTAIGEEIGAFIGGVVLGSLGKLLGHAIGKYSGNLIGGAIVKVIKRDNVAVKKMNDLKRGDQVVLYVRLSHPRCHVLVLEHDGASKIKVIRSTYGRGVVEEWITFIKPIYKVVYQDNECRSVEESICKARLEIGKRNYNLFSNNCKHFASKCKLKDSSM